MKILILGKKGWLGNIFYEYIKDEHEVFFFDGDINDFEGSDADVVVNFAGSTNIDWCEKNKNKAFWNNVLGPVSVAKKVKRYVFISSACIFESRDINDVKFEDSTPSPWCFYTETKLMAEKLIMEINPDSLIVRPRMPISEIPHPRNLLNKLASYTKLVDSQESVTVVEDFIPKLLELICEGAKGVRNLVNEGSISPVEIGVLIGHTFESIDKSTFKEFIISKGKANRVSTVVGSKYGYLPPIQSKIKNIIEKWKTNTI